MCLEGEKMTISAIAVQRPRCSRICPMCVKRIRGGCLRLYGAAFRGDKPYTMYLCHECAVKASGVDPKVKTAVETLDRMAA